MVLKTIRRKIKGEANDILVSNNTQLIWDDIKEVLRLYYADKRDLMTLDNQLKTMTRRPNDSIESYYSRVREMTTLISSAISTDEAWKGHETALIKLYNMMALDTFIRGLGEPLSMFCKNYKPQSLAAAYSYCVEFLNLNARNAPFKASAAPALPVPRNMETKPFPKQSVPFRTNLPPPPPPPRNIYPTQHPSPAPRLTAPNTQTNFQANPNRFAPPRTFYPQQPKPEPMEVDSSMQSRAINYGNRPPIKTARPTTESMQANNPPAKRMAYPLEEIVETPGTGEITEQGYQEVLEEHEVEEIEGENQCEAYFLEVGWKNLWQE